MNDMVVEANRRTPLETGGVLMGYWSPDGAQVVVTAVVGPGPRAIHARSRFVPDAKYHEAEVARIYAASGRLHTYLGDWHTHPDAAAYLSSTDLSTLHRIGAYPAARASTPLMLVLGGGPAWSIAGWIALPARKRFGRVRKEIKQVRLRITPEVPGTVFSRP